MDLRRLKLFDLTPSSIFQILLHSVRPSAAVIDCLRLLFCFGLLRKRAPFAAGEGVDREPQSFRTTRPPIPPNGRHEEFPVAANTGPESTKRNNDPIFVWHDILLCTADGGGGGCGCGGGCRLLYVPVFVAAVKKSFGSACYDDKL